MKIQNQQLNNLRRLKSNARGTINRENNMPDSITEFFMVWSESGCSPTIKHPSLDIAKAEAERLTKKHGGQYHVLKSVGTTKRNDVIWIDHEIDDIPF